MNKDLCGTDVPTPITFPLKNGKEYTLGSEKILMYIDTYPDIDVCAELKKARMWNIDNPSKRKTERGICSHLNKWLSGVSGKQQHYSEDDWRKDYV